MTETPNWMWGGFNTMINGGWVTGGEATTYNGGHRDAFVSKIHDTNPTVPSGTLQVTIEPAAAVVAGAKWRRVGTTTWLDAGTSETTLPIRNRLEEPGQRECHPQQWSNGSNQQNLQ